MRLLSARAKNPEEHRQRRRLGFPLFFGALILLFLLVRAIPADWEIGPFRIDVSGTAADPQASLYFADDPQAPFWLLVPTFNLPARFFAARPNSSPRPVALAPTDSATPSPSDSASASPSPSPSPLATPTPSASLTPAPTPTPTSTPPASLGDRPDHRDSDQHDDPGRQRSQRMGATHDQPGRRQGNSA